MPSPPRGPDGRVQPHDDVKLLPDGGVIRHINPDAHVTDDENTGKRRISSNAFSCTSGDPDFGMSVDIEQLLIAARMKTDAMVPEGYGAVRLRIGDIRDIGLKVGSDPIPQNSPDGAVENPFHGQVWGVRPRFRRKLHELVNGWVKELPGIEIR